MGLYTTGKHNSLWLDFVVLCVCLNRLGAWKSVLNWAEESCMVCYAEKIGRPTQAKLECKGLGEAVKTRFQGT